MTLGRLEKQQPDGEAEIAFYKQVLRKHPERIHLLDFLAYALFKQAEYIEAIHCWKKLLKKQGTKEAHIVLARIAQSYELLGEMEQAYHYYEKVQRISENNLEIIGKYGEIAYLLENYNDALGAFRIIVNREPYNEIAWHNLALSYYNLGLHDEAIECLEKSLEIDDESADSWYTLASIYSENYLVNDALFTLERALSLDATLINKAKKEQSFYPLMESKLFQYLIS